MTPSASAPSPARSGVRLEDADGGWLAGVGGEYLPEPYLMPRAEALGLGADSLLVARVLHDAGRRLGHRSPATWAAELGHPVEVQRLLEAADGLPDPLFGRVDALRTATGPRVLEVNATSETGGLEWVDVAGHGWQEVPEVADRLRRIGAEWVSPLDALAAALRSYAARTVGVDHPRIALVGGPVGLAEHGHAWHPLRDQLVARGLPTVVTDVWGLEVDESGVRHGGEPVHVVYRIFELSQIAADAAALAVVHEVVDAAQRGQVAVWTSLASELARDKRLLALVSARDERLALDDEERAALDRVLPRTILLEGPPSGEVLTDLLARRAACILKPARGYASAGIVAGWEVDDDAWRAALAATGPAVVQERVVALADAVHRTVVEASGTSVEPWVGEAVLGVYYLEGVGFAGGGARVHEHGEPFVTAGPLAPPAQRAAIHLVDEDPR